MSKVGRNDPCPCGSGKKFKKCCEEKVKSKKFEAKPIINGQSPIADKTSSLSHHLFSRVVPPAPIVEQEPKNLEM